MSSVLRPPEDGAAPLPTAADVAVAAERLRGVATLTPMLRNPALDERAGCTVLVKPEVLQRTGSFKFRGAYNRLSRLVESDAPRAVVAFSSGNHAQGVAAAARLLGFRATIVMPSDAPASKRAATAALGAEIVTYDRWSEDREAIARRIAAEHGATLVPPFDDPDIIAGQGTLALELADQAAAAGLRLDALLTPAGGGGLAAGIALALERASPDTRLYTAEPAGFDDHARSFAAGERLENDPDARSICDALLAPMPGRLTFAINHPRYAGGFAVDDKAVGNAMRFAFERLKLVVEPGGAVALAALLENHRQFAGQTVGLVLSGGNVDAPTFRECVEI